MAINSIGGYKCTNVKLLNCYLTLLRKLNKLLNVKFQFKGLQFASLIHILFFKQLILTTLYEAWIL